MAQHDGNKRKRWLLMISMYFITSLYAHSALELPKSRGGEGAPLDPARSCPGQPGAATTLQRGQTIPTQWNRNNHNSGFVRYSIVDTKFSGVQNVFNDPKRVFHYECAEKACTADKTGTIEEKLKDGPSTCKGTLTIPNWVKDGTYTIQWIWYGTGNNRGDIYGGLQGFFSCSDIKIEGGAALVENESTLAATTDTIGTQCPATSTQTFTPGDVNGTEGCQYNLPTEGKAYGCLNNDCPCAANTFEGCYKRGPPPEMCPGAGNAKGPTTPVGTAPLKNPTTPTTPTAPVVNPLVVDGEQATQVPPKVVTPSKGGKCNKTK